MDEEREQESAPIDVVWEFRKLDTRFMDVLDMIEDLKAKDKSLSARIARLKLDVIGNIEEEEFEEEGSFRDQPRNLENLTMEERALLVAKIMDRREEDTLDE